MKEERRKEGERKEKRKGKIGKEVKTDKHRF